MLLALWILVQIGLIAAGAFWAFRQPGSVGLHLFGYDITANPGIAFLLLVAAFYGAMLAYRFLGFLFSLPRRWREGALRRRRDKGYRALTLGLCAVAAGDKKLASYHAFRMRKMMPDEKGLPFLLEAQAARLRGNAQEAQGFFERLLKDKDTSFLGVRGLLQAAIESADIDRALTLARQARNMHPDQPWIVRTLFGLETQKHEWAAAFVTLKKSEPHKIWNIDTLKHNRIALFLQQADELGRAGYRGESLRQLKNAQKLDPAFVPTALRLARHYSDEGKRRAAIAVIEHAWHENPHPALVPMWERLAPAKKSNDLTAHLHWFERLVALRPGDAESQLAAAQAAIRDNLWGEAWQYLAAAEKIRPNARLYRLWAQMEEKTGHGESARRYWEKAASAPPDKVWFCTETGHIYESWSAIAEPHGAFNTIVWGFPSERAPTPVLPSGGHDLVIEPVRALGVTH